MSSRQSECGCSCCLPWSRCCCNTPDDLDGRKVAVRNLKSSQRQQGSANNIAARNSGADKDTNAVFTEGTDDKRRHSEISARSFGAHSLRSTVGSINAAAAAAGSSGDGGTAGMALRRKKKAPQRDDRIAIRVLLLDDTYGTFHISRNAKGQELFDMVCEDVNIWERDYFGLRYQDSQEQLYWLEVGERVTRQLKVSPILVCYFCVKFYLGDPTSLSEEITRYQYFLQLKRDIQYGRVLVSHDTAVHLFACAVQSELGDFNEEEFGEDYVSEFLFLPEECQTREFEQEVVDHHRKLSGMVPSAAEQAFLDRVHCLPLYGVDLHPVKGTEGTDLQVGVGHSGLSVFQNAARVGFYQWPKIKKIQFKKTVFTLQVAIGDSRGDKSECLRYRFHAPSSSSCKELWKCCVQQHRFFRRVAVSPDKNVSVTGGILLGSKSMSSIVNVPRTNFQVQEESKNRKRTEPSFERAPSRRSNRSLPAELEFPRLSHRWPRVSSTTSVSNVSDVVLSARESVLRPIRRGTNKWRDFRRNSQVDKSDKISVHTASVFENKLVSRSVSMPLRPDDWPDQKVDDPVETEMQQRQEMEQLRQGARTPIRRRTAWSSEDEDNTRPSTTSDDRSLSVDLQHRDRFSPAGASSGTPTAMLHNLPHHHFASGKRHPASTTASSTTSHSRQDSISSFYKMMRRHSRVGAINPAVPCTPQSDLSLSASPRYPLWPWSQSDISSSADNQFLELHIPGNTYHVDSPVATAAASARGSSILSSRNDIANSTSMDTDEEHTRRLMEMWNGCVQDGEDMDPPINIRRTSHLDQLRRYGVHSLYWDGTHTTGIGESSDPFKNYLPTNGLRGEDFAGLEGEFATTPSSSLLPGQLSREASPYATRRGTHSKDDPRQMGSTLSIPDRRKTVCVGLPMVTSSSNQSVDSGHPSSPVSPQSTPLTSKGSTLSGASVPSTASYGTDTSTTATSVSKVPEQQNFNGGHSAKDRPTTASSQRSERTKSRSTTAVPHSQQFTSSASHGALHDAGPTRARGKVHDENSPAVRNVQSAHATLKRPAANKSKQSTTTQSRASEEVDATTSPTKMRKKYSKKPVAQLVNIPPADSAKPPLISPRSTSLASSSSFRGTASQTNHHEPTEAMEMRERSSSIGMAQYRSTTRKQHAKDVGSEDTHATPPRSSSQHRRKKGTAAREPLLPPTHSPPVAASASLNRVATTDVEPVKRSPKHARRSGDNMLPPPVSTDAEFLDEIICQVTGNSKEDMRAFLSRDASKSSPSLNSTRSPVHLVQRHQWFN